MYNVCRYLYKGHGGRRAMNALREFIHLLFNKKQATKSSTPTANPDCQRRGTAVFLPLTM